MVSILYTEHDIHASVNNTTFKNLQQNSKHPLFKVKNERTIDNCTTCLRYVMNNGVEDIGFW